MPRLGLWAPLHLATALRVVGEGASRRSRRGVAGFGRVTALPWLFPGERDPAACLTPSDGSNGASEGGRLPATAPSPAIESATVRPECFENPLSGRKQLKAALEITDRIYTRMMIGVHDDAPSMVFSALSKRTNGQLQAIRYLSHCPVHRPPIWYLPMKLYWPQEESRPRFDSLECLESFVVTGFSLTLVIPYFGQHSGSDASIS